MPNAFDVLRTLADGNHSVVSRRVARAIGVSDASLRRLVLTGTLVRIARGVYAIGPAPLEDPRVIARRHKVVISHESAAAVLGAQLPSPVKRTHAIGPRSRGQRKHGYTGVELHRSNLPLSDLTIVRGIPVTTHLRTAVDVSRRSSLENAVAIVDSFIRNGDITVTQFVAAATRAKGPGRARLQLVGTLIDPQSASVLESLTRVLLWRRQMCPPQSQFSLRHRPSKWRGRVDFAWPDLKVVLECDGYEWHSDRDAFKRDRRRWNALTQMGWRLAVVTWFDVTEDPDYVVAIVRDLVGPNAASLQQHTKVMDVADGAAA